MQVRHILQEKGRHIIAVAEAVTVAEAAKMLAEKRIGVVLVKNGETALAGILSERDVVRAVAVDGAEALSRPVPPPAGHGWRERIVRAGFDR